ncbi:adenylate cyclase regulatory domain-containing protein [Streptosporangium vulgare]|uniref:adenylate cyclase regulatory domain-containing protein n=1 Tax=Streptosporangium vulgare TaxID=46190 RepID=UPI0031E34D6D
MGRDLLGLGEDGDETEVPAGRPTAERIERLFVGASPRYTRIQVASLARVPQELTERIWRALGFATLPDDTVAFTDADVAVLERVRTMMESGLLDDRTVIRMSRALGQTTARLAQWQAEIMIGAMLDPRPTAHRRGPGGGHGDLAPAAARLREGAGPRLARPSSPPPGPAC